jgi:hypothetical protein
VGLDRLGVAAAVLFALACCGCDDGSDRPTRLLHGEAAGEFKPVPGSVVSIARVLRAGTLGRRIRACRDGAVPASTLVVERIGVFGESLTFADSRGEMLFACDGGSDPAGERHPPWCSGSAARLFDGHLLDPRLDLGCRDRDGHPIAYAWVEPVAGARWIGVDQGSYIEVYEVVGHLPVRITALRHIDLGRSRATFDVRQYAASGRELVEGKLEAGVAG